MNVSYKGRRGRILAAEGNILCPPCLGSGKAATAEQNSGSGCVPITLSLQKRAVGCGLWFAGPQPKLTEVWMQVNLPVWRGPRRRGPPCRAGPVPTVCSQGLRGCPAPALASAGPRKHRQQGNSPTCPFSRQGQAGTAYFGAAP